MKDRSDWMLNNAVFREIQGSLGPLTVDLFATRLTTQLPRFYSWRPDPLAEATDAFLQDWGSIQGYANPPWSLIGRVLAKVVEQEASVVIITPVWPSQPWYPLLLSLLVGTPLRLRPQRDLIGGENRHSPITPYVSHGSAGAVNGTVIPFLDLEEVVNFLAHLFTNGYQYRSVNAYRSAIASMHLPIDGVSIGQHPLVSRLLKGVYHARPPLPRYSGTWDVSRVLTHLSSQRVDKDVSLKVLTLKTVMLLALTRPSRSVDLARLDISGCRQSPEGFCFLPVTLAKQARQGKKLAEFFFPAFNADPSLSLVRPQSLFFGAQEGAGKQKIGPGRANIFFGRGFDLENFLNSEIHL